MSRYIFLAMRNRDKNMIKRKQYRTCNGCAVGKATYCYLGTGHSRRWAQEGNCTSFYWGPGSEYEICDLGYKVEEIEHEWGSMRFKSSEGVFYRPLEKCFKPKNFKQCKYAGKDTKRDFRERIINND